MARKPTPAQRIACESLADSLSRLYDDFRYEHGETVDACFDLNRRGTPLRHLPKAQRRRIQRAAGAVEEKLMELQGLAKDLEHWMSDNWM